MLKKTNKKHLVFYHSGLSLRLVKVKYALLAFALNLSVVLISASVLLSLFMNSYECARVKTVSSSVIRQKALLLVASISRRPNPLHKLYKMSIQSRATQTNS